MLNPPARIYIAVQKIEFGILWIANMKFRILFKKFNEDFVFSDNFLEWKLDFEKVHKTPHQWHLKILEIILIQSFYHRITKNYLSKIVVKTVHKIFFFNFRIHHLHHQKTKQRLYFCFFLFHVVQNSFRFISTLGRHFQNSFSWGLIANLHSV